MKRTKARILLCILLCLSLISADALPLFANYQAQASLPNQQVNLIESKNANGEYVISVFTDEQWQEAGSLGYSEFLTESALDLSGYLTENSSAKVRILQEGGEAAHLDCAFLGGEAPQSVNCNDEVLLGKLSKKDLDLITVVPEGIELVFPENRDNDILSFTGRIEGERITKEPFKFPSENTYKEINESSEFYSYKLNSASRKLTVDGSLEEVEDLEPLFAELCVPGTGHPEGYTYGWVMNDAEYLYAVVDFTPDNTMDGDKDYAKLYAKTDAGIKEFKVSVPENAWGQPAFIYNDKVEYQHKIYEFKIPLSEFGDDGSDTLSLAFSAYGTAAPPPIEIDGYYDEGEDRSQPSVAYDPLEDRYLLVYTNGGYALEDNGIMGQFITNDAAVDGERIPIEVRHEEDSYILKRSPDVAYGDGMFLAVWIDNNFYNYKVMGRFIASDGSFLTDEFGIDNENSYIRDFYLSVAYGEDGKFLVVWSDGDDVVGSMVSHDKSTEPHTGIVSEEIQISLDDYFYRSPSVAYSEESGKFLVAWDDDRISSSDSNIYGRLVSIDGSPEPGEISICTAPHKQFSPSVTYDSYKKVFFLIWGDEEGVDSDAVNYGIYGNYFDPEGNPQISGEGELIIVGSDTGYIHPTIVYSGMRDEYLPIWADTPYYGDNDSAAYGSGQQLDKDLEEADTRLTFGDGIYNRFSPKLDLTSSTVAGKYLVVYPCIYSNLAYDTEISYLKWDLIGDEAPANPGKLQFEFEQNNVDEDGGTKSIKVIRTAGYDGQVKVNYSTEYLEYANSATPGTDYNTASGTLTFENGEREKTFYITILNDDIIEGYEHVGLKLSEPTGGAELGSISSANLYINDDDSPNVKLSSSSYTVVEAVYEKYIDIPVVFSGFPIIPRAFSEYDGNEAMVFSVVYETSNGTALAGNDYTSVTGTLEFGWESSEKNFRIPIIDDSIDEVNETVNLKLSFPEQKAYISNVSEEETIWVDDYPVTLGTPKTAILTITDDDNPPPSDPDPKPDRDRKTTPTVVIETPPPTENLPNDALVGRMPGYVAISIPVKINEVRNEISLSYNKTTLSNNPGHDARIYYWRPEVEKWVALATYPDGDGKVKAINDGGYKGWFVVFGVVQPHFTDVGASWAEQLINRMNGLGLIEGYAVKGSDLRMARPEQKVTRAEFTMFITRIMNMNPDNVLLPNIPDSEVESILSQGYTDGAEISPWVRSAVAKATKAGLVPFEGSSFEPLEPITRIEAGVMVSRALKKFKDFKTIDLTGFKDSIDIPGWAVDEVVENALLGYTDNTLKPNADIARAESLAMLLRLFIKGLGW